MSTQITATEAQFRASVIARIAGLTVTPEQDETLESAVDSLYRFAPTFDQLIYAAKYARDFGLDSVFVAVEFPGKERGVWTSSQERKPVYDEANTKVFALWVERDNALADLDLGHAGNAVFRVYNDLNFNLVDEA